MVSAIDPIDSRLKIVTPENIAFYYQAAGPFRRLTAFLIDIAIRVSIYGTIMTIVVCSGVLDSFGPMAELGNAIAFLSYFVLDWFYGALFETYWNGQTPGKRALSIRAVTVDGEPINALQAFGRNLFRYADMMPLAPLPFEWLREGVNFAGPILPTFLIGLIVPAFNKRFQRLGDLLVATMVVIEDRSWLMKIAKIEDDRARQLADYIPANFVARPSLCKAVATYVERRRFFTTARRREIARHLAEPMLRQFNLPADTSYDLMLCALYYRTFLSDRSADGTASQSSVYAGGPPGSSPTSLPSSVESLMINR
ncbi:RDD family protein [Blastopirellula sp. JC732]|uniref:RDD family protein n=1 Tax=Blastopirellula sediminis TaxID=2894196 RepID=A0A9X1SEJ7_9BACT|nr:RDD family protein [Blastopirellula sediminis]MCC9609298.1 RDD family protein [Blastopirellula sediminis]MCC9627925.1 RDD family protein [Blastopirellula sediminis]